MLETEHVFHVGPNDAVGCCSDYIGEFIVVTIDASKPRVMLAPVQTKTGGKKKQEKKKNMFFLFQQNEGGMISQPGFN